MLNVNRDFENWACSFSGCDGGNLAAPLWFCGIEWGGGAGADWLRKNIDSGAISQPSHINVHQIEEQFAYQFDQKLLKIYSVLTGEEASNYKAISIKNGYLTKEGPIFKMNLYPVSFGNTSEDLWSRAHHEITGLATKSMYKALCQCKRFPMIKAWIQQASPKVVVCAGQTLYLEFIMAFCGIQEAHDVKTKLTEVSIANRMIRWVMINDNKTLLVITPFFGNAYGLNSDEQLEGVAREITKLANSHFGAGWLQQSKSESVC